MKLEALLKMLRFDEAGGVADVRVVYHFSQENNRQVHKVFDGW